jgi:DNA-binding response OmpR family regulator
MQQNSNFFKFTIAIIEENENIRVNICNFLGQAGVHAWGAESVEKFYITLLREKADLVVVDLSLPREDKLCLIERLAEQCIPVVVLTARSDLCSCITGLTTGALRYFVEPDDLHALAASLRAQLTLAATVTAPVKLALNGGHPAWHLDKAAARLVAPNRHSIPLTSRELQLMVHLYAADENIVGKKELLDAMGYAYVQDGFHRIESQLNRLRRKTLQSTGMPLPIRAVFGKGLVFVSQHALRE